MFDDVLKHRSGRVIALARLVLASVFLLAIWVDPTQPSQAPVATYTALAGYLVFAVALVLLTWDNWWREAKLAAPSHIVDILMFTLLVLLSDGYTSPFFVFFVFLLVSAAIRWGWRETAITAAAVTLFYFGAGLVGGDSGDGELEVQRFIIRSGNLLTLSALLIWFGVNHGFGALRVMKDDLLTGLSPQNSPLETAVEGAVRMTRARAALLVWVEAERSGAIAVSKEGPDTPALVTAEPIRTTVPERPFLFDLERSRAFARGPHRRMRFCNPETMLDAASARRAGAPPETGAEPRRGRGRPATYVQLGANHTFVFSDEIRIRPGLDPVDLLEGGAIGIASGRVRHQADGTAAITSGGLGARLGVTWRGKSTLDTRIGNVEDALTFSPLLTFNLRAFADTRRIFPNSDWARGTRASLNLVNVTNQRQRVRDSFGNTPLQYQAGYRDPLGRTIEFEIRKVF